MNLRRPSTPLTLLMACCFGGKGHAAGLDTYGLVTILGCCLSLFARPGEPGQMIQ